MTVKELIEELKKYHDQDEEVEVAGLGVKRVVIGKNGGVAELLSEYPYSVVEKLEDICEDLNEIDEDDMTVEDMADIVQDVVYGIKEVLQWLNC